MRRLFVTADIRSALAIICVLGVFGLIILLTFQPIPKQNSELIYMAFGQVLALGFGVVIGYFFGSSKNESDAAKTTKTS